MAGDSSMQAISRAASVLSAVSASPDGLTLAQVTEASGLPRSTTHRVLRALSAEGLVSTSRRHTYVIGMRAAELAAPIRRRIVERSAPVLGELARQIAHPLHLYGFTAGLISEIDVGIALGPPPRCPLSPLRSAAGKAVLAMLDDATASATIDHALRDDHESTGRPAPDLERIRTTGIAWERDERSAGLSAIAVGFRTPLDDVMAVSVDLPSERFRVEAPSLAPLLLAARDDLVALAA